jgi:hypothetical protein
MKERQQHGTITKIVCCMLLYMYIADDEYCMFDVMYGCMLCDD